MSAFFEASVDRKTAEWNRFAAVVSALAILFAALAGSYAQRFHVDLRTAGGIYACFVLLLSVALLPAMRAGRALLSRIGPRWRDMWVFSLLCLPYLLYAVGSGDFRWGSFLRVAALAIIPPFFYVLFPPRGLARFSGSDFLVGLLLICIVLGGLLRGIWTTPVDLDFMGRLLLLAVCSMMWTSVRPVPALNYRLEITRNVLHAAAVNFLYFAVIAIPAGLLIGFTAWHPRWLGIGAFCLNYIEIFLFIALLEEMFFRGFLQSLLTASFGSRVLAQLAVSVLFGLFHILHAPFPNWRYVALATLAGWFYGEAYTRGGTLFASALTHAMVDTVWRTWFSKS